jgi:hypothetical protein
MSTLKYFIIVTIILVIFFTNVLSPNIGYAAQFYSEDTKPFGIPYKDWTAKWWNWTMSINKNNFTSSELAKNNCAPTSEGDVFFMIGPGIAAGEPKEKTCNLTTQQAVLLTFLTGECDTGIPEAKNYTYRQLSDCAFEDNQAPIFTKSAFVDGVQVPDSNIKEIRTDEFNLAFKPGNYYDADPGTFKAAAHGYYLFVEPLPEGNHTIKYLANTEGVEWRYASTVTYNFIVSK